MWWEVPCNQEVNHMKNIKVAYQKLNLGTFVITEVLEQIYSAYAGTLPSKIDKEINKLLNLYK